MNKQQQQQQQNNKQIVIYDQKLKLNENRFYLQTKIPINIKIRYKKKFTKKSMGDGGDFSGEQFSGGKLSRVKFSKGYFSGRVIFLGGIFHTTIHKIFESNSSFHVK